MTHPIPKKAVVAAVKDERDVRLENTPEKKLGTWLRTASMPAVTSATSETQFGSGLHGGSTEVTFISHQAAVDAAEAHGLSAISFYFDICCAFAEVRRCLVMQDFECQQRLVESLVGHGLDAQAAKIIVDEVADCGFWRKHGASEHLEAQLKACLSNSFTTLDGTPGGIKMLRGAGAGNPLAESNAEVEGCTGSGRTVAVLSSSGSQGLSWNWS